MEKLNIDADSVVLTHMKVNEKAVVKKLKTEDRLKLRKLTAFGIMPGVEISIIQKYPAIVIQAGFTQVALDDDIASEILVFRDNKQ